MMPSPQPMSRSRPFDPRITVCSSYYPGAFETNSGPRPRGIADLADWCAPLTAAFVLTARVPEHLPSQGAEVTQYA